MEFKKPSHETPKNKRENIAFSLEFATENDWEAVRDLRVEAITGKDQKMFIGDNPDWIKFDTDRTEKEWRDEIKDPKNFTILSYADKKLIGMGRGWENPEVPGIYLLGHAYTKEEFRGNDFGKKNFASRIREVIRRHGIHIMLNIWKDNTTMMTLSKSFGLELRSDKPNDKGFYTMDLSNLENPELLKKLDEVLDSK